MKLNKNQIKIINRILKQYRKWAGNFIENIDEKEKSLKIFYEKYKNNLNLYIINAKKELMILNRKSDVYSNEKTIFQTVFSTQMNQFNLLKETIKMKKEKCDEEKKKFKNRIGDLYFYLKIGLKRNIF